MAMLNYGFLLNYADEAMLSDLPDETYGKLIRACVEYQRSGGKTPFPKTDDSLLKIFYPMFERKIKLRLSGQKGGLANVERNGDKFEDHFEHYRIKGHNY